MGRYLSLGVLAVNVSVFACTGTNVRSTAPTVPSPPSSPSSSCSAANAQFAIGNPASDDLLERARVAAQAASARFLRPNDRVTMEFLASRLNLNLSKQGIVYSAYCG
jgi:hypothetical protein